MKQSPFPKAWRKKASTRYRKMTAASVFSSSTTSRLLQRFSLPVHQVSPNPFFSHSYSCHSHLSWDHPCQRACASPPISTPAPHYPQSSIHIPAQILCTSVSSSAMLCLLSSCLALLLSSFCFIHNYPDLWPWPLPVKSLPACKPLTEIYLSPTSVCIQVRFCVPWVWQQCVWTKEKDVCSNGVQLSTFTQVVFLKGTH